MACPTSWVYADGRGLSYQSSLRRFLCCLQSTCRVPCTAPCCLHISSSLPVKLGETVTAHIIQAITCFHPRVFPGRVRVICNLDKLFWMMVAATTVHPSSCCYTRTGFRLGQGQGNCSAHPVCERDKIACYTLVPFSVLFSQPCSTLFPKSYSSRPSLLY